MKTCQKVSINKKVVKKGGLQICYLMGFWMTRGSNLSEQNLGFFFFTFFLSFFLFFFFSPNNLIQHSVNSDNMYGVFLHEWQNNHFTAVQAVCTFWKILINLAFANRRDPVFQQLCRKNNVLSYSSGIVSISTSAFFCSLSITFLL